MVHGTRDTPMKKGHYHFVNEMLLNIIEMDFLDLMPPNEDQSTRQNSCRLVQCLVLQSSMLLMMMVVGLQEQFLPTCITTVRQFSS